MNYKTFKVGELFGPAKNGKYHSPKNLQEDDNGYEFICASNLNNGVNLDMPRVTGTNLSLTPAHIIAWGKQCPFFTYHEEPCVTNQGMYYYPVGQLSELSALFLCSCFQSACASKYDYSHCLIGTLMDDEEIQLPVTDSGEPDWQYMEDYMRDIMSEVEQRLDALSTDIVVAEPLPPTNYKTFTVGDLFDVMTTKGDIKPGKNVAEGNIPFISANDTNNGIAAYVDEHGDKKSQLFEGNCLTIGIFCTAYYQPNDFYMASHGRAFALLPKFELSERLGLFITSVINLQNSYYNYNNFLTASKIKELDISLPVTDSGEPDWQYMEDYMKKVLTDMSDKLDVLKTSLGI